ncbi:sulfotransferase [Phenylobacterium sp.]|uniref:sulfotransferase family protein n=1 Tax=Phenylobacterium sp. TaxID=1871053 RepID=UPI00301D0FB1
MTVPAASAPPYTGPLFVVGAPRSGSELLCASLNRHPAICIVGETHYFADLRRRLRSGQSPLTEDEAQICRAHFADLHHRYGSSSLAGTCAALPASTGEASTGDAEFENFCREQARRRGKWLWGEKTPRHIFQADQILAAFPGARILVLVRDPRGVVASYRDWRNQWLFQEKVDDRLLQASAREDRRIRASYSLPIIALLWKSAARTARRLKARHGQSRVKILRFEDLLDEPQVFLSRICDWLGVKFDPAMLDMMVVNSSYVAPGTRQGRDRGAIMRWRQALSPNEIGLVEALGGKELERFGYEATGLRGSVMFAAREIVSIPVTFMRALLANRDRLGRIGPFLLERLKALI